MACQCHRPKLFATILRKFRRKGKIAGMTQKPAPQPTQAERRKVRQAAALRDNLKRRKAAARKEAVEEPDESTQGERETDALNLSVSLQPRQI